MLIKQIHCHNQGQGLFIPFFYDQAIWFYENTMHILGQPYEIEEIIEVLAERWNDIMKTEIKAAWINHYERARDGRKTCQSLVADHKGDSMKTRYKQECCESIAKTSYWGVTRSFDFNT
jgi:hypothetical protein